MFPDPRDALVIDEGGNLIAGFGLPVAAEAVAVKRRRIQKLRTRPGRPVARLTAIAPAETGRRFGAMKSRPWPMTRPLRST